jgi:hypothetical protein
MIQAKMVRLTLLQSAAILALSAQAALAGNLGVNLNINLGEPRPVYVAPPPAAVYVAPPPVYAPPPAAVYVAPPPPYAPPMEVIGMDDDIQFVYPEGLGFYVAVGVPYDLFYLHNSYFLWRDGRWLRASSSRGPWVVQRYRDLPQGLRRHRLERIREYRTREYALYSRDRDHYRGKHFRAEKEPRKEQHRVMQELRKEQQREVKERRKDEQHLEKAQRKDERRQEKEQRQEEKRGEKEERREHREGRGN